MESKKEAQEALDELFDMAYGQKYKIREIRSSNILQTVIDSLPPDEMKLSEENEKLHRVINAILCNLAHSRDSNDKLGQFAHSQAYGNAYNMVNSTYETVMKTKIIDDLEGK